MGAEEKAGAGQTTGTAARRNTEKWLIEECAGRLAQVLEAMTSQPCRVESPDGPPAELASPHWWRQPLSLCPDAEIWVGAEVPAWDAIGGRALKAAGIEEAEVADRKSTYQEIVTQAISGAAQSIGARVGREVSCQTGQQSGAVPQTAAVFPLEIRFEDGQAVRLVLGFSQPLVAELDPQAGGASETSTRTNGEPGMAGAPMAASPKTLDLLMEVELPVSVSFGRSQLPLKDVLKLTTGSIVELNRSVAEPVEVIVNNCVIARGEVVVVEGNYGVRIRQIISRQERLRNLN